MYKSRDNAIGIATGYGLDGRADSSSSPGGGKSLLLSTLSRPVLGPTQLPIQWLPGDLLPWVKRPGREADHSPPTSADVKNKWLYTSTPHAFSWRSA
jgi:hypothetical protein